LVEVLDKLLSDAHGRAEAVGRHYIEVWPGFRIL
jgi:hypothetical protein